MMSEEETLQSAGKDHPFRVADWHVAPATSRISRGDEAVKLEPKVMEVLVYLAGRPGEVVTREELEATVWAGTVVGYDALSGAMLKLRKAFNDDPKRPRIIETLSKKGYRLVAPVHRAEPAGATQTLGKDLPAVRPQIRWLRAGPAAVLLILVAAAGLLFWLGPWKATDDTADKGSTLISIAVLPFDNLSGDSEQEYFADGMTDDLITDLTQISSLLVIARDSTFTYKGGSPDVRQVARKLNVRYVLHGSVRRAGERVRINAQLTDATTGSQLWAERYDGEIRDIFGLQDKITQKIVSALAVKLTTGERQNLARQQTNNLEAYEYFLQGRERFFRFSRDDTREAREFFQKAIELDPNFAIAYAMLAWTHAFDAMNGWSDVRERSLEHAHALATKAIALNDALPVAYFVTGLVYRERGEYVKALVEAEKAIAIDPNYANGHVLVATLLYYAGRPKEGLDRMKKAIQLNPYHPHNYPFHLGQVYFVLKRYNEAINAFKRGLKTKPGSERLRIWLAASYAHAGRIKDAKWQIDVILIENPEFSLQRIRQAFPFKDPADLEHFLDGLRKADLTK